MNWLARKCDSLIGAIFGGVGGASASQFDAFVQQYLQRLGGHVDEAQLHYKAVLDPDRYRDMPLETHAALLADARTRVDQLDLALRAIADADLWHRPFAFAAHMDTDIVARTWGTFRPAVPVDAAGLIYAATGVVLGLILYELLKAPCALALHRRRRMRQPIS